jgi:DNA topoisomerase-2
MRYSKVYISTDADPDGSSINNLIVNLFHEYFPELFWNKEMPFLYRILFPNIVAIKGKRVKYYPNREDFENKKDKDGIDGTWKIKYYKGLGSMSTNDWEFIFKNLDEYSVAIYDDGYLDEMMYIMFNENSNVRKEWLSYNDNMVIG